MNKIYDKSMNVQTPLVINLAPTGMIPTKEMSPHVPIQPIEIIDDILNCADIGITMVHIHARNDQGQPTYKKETYEKIISKIREKRSDLIIGVSCSGRNFSSFEQRADVLNLTGDLRPDMASLTLSSMNFARKASINEPDIIFALAERMIEKSILPEFEIFDLGMINYANYIIEKLGHKQPSYANIMLGNIFSAQADLLSIATLTSLLPPDTIWGLGGIGSSQISVSALGAAIAPGIRVGLEDNLWEDHSRYKLATNVGMVERAHNIAKLTDRTVMTPSALRRKLNLASW